MDNDLCIVIGDDLMATYDDRLDALERKVTSLELRRLYDESRESQSTPVAQAHNLKEMNENITILLGIISRQEENVREVKNDVGIIKDSLGQVENRLDNFESRFDILESHFKTLDQSVNSRFETQEKKLDQILLLLAAKSNGEL